MQQIYHSNATTNLNIRTELQNSSATNSELAKRFNTSVQTVSKWRNRDFKTDKSSAPINIKYALTDIDKALAKSIRETTWMTIDNVYEVLKEHKKSISKSSVYRYLVSQNLNIMPAEKIEVAKKFKEYKPGFLHIDVTYLPKIDGTKYYLFVAIDRATRAMCCEIYDAKTADNAEDFLNRCIDFFPCYISHVLTDNGLEFTNHLLKSKKGESCKKPSKIDLVCKENQIEHRLTKPFTPKTNGMVERLNGTIKNNTILVTKYLTFDEMKKDLINFMIVYNLYRKHGSLKKELNVKTPFDAVEKWYELEPEIFKNNPCEFKNKLIILQNEIDNSSITL